MSWFLKNDILKILDATQEERENLQNHKIYNSIKNIDLLQVFMSNHVFAVWDFMSILKSLQNQLTCVDVPWIPSGKGTPARLVNEIVIEEESDMDRHGQHMSHFEMYCHAMIQAGTDINPINQFLHNIKSSNVMEALIISNAPQAASNFVNNTFQILDGAPSHVVASMFTFGREEVIPDMFRKIIREIDSSLQGKLKSFIYYLDRHIGLDENEHTPLALRMVKELCSDDEKKWTEATNAAKACMKSRIKFWDEISDEIHKN